MQSEKGREVGWLKSEHASDDEARRELAYQSGIPFVVLAKEDISLDSLALIPEPLARKHNIIAYRHGDGEVEVALLNIDDLHTVEFLRRKFKVRARLTSRETIKRALLMYQKQLKDKFASLVEKGGVAADALLRHALHSNATHIHLEPSLAAMLVRYRINGMLHEAMRLPEHANKYITEQLKSLAKLFPISTAAQEGRFKIEHEGREYTVRVSTVPSVQGEKMLLRLAREEHGQKGFTLSSLGFHGEGLERMHELLNSKKGVVVVCGPRESGVTTTLYTLLDELNNPHLAVSTIEEKVEYSLHHVSQTQTRPEVGLDLLAGLRAVLRSDPDVVMVSDISQKDVAELAARSTKRGVLVIAGMITKNPEKVFEVLEPMFPQAIVNQRLVRRLCDDCKERYHPSREEMGVFESQANFGRILYALKDEKLVDDSVAWKELDFYRAKGCSKCTDGYSGQLGVQEILEEDSQALSLIEDGIFKAAQGLTTLEEVVYLAQ